MMTRTQKIAQKKLDAEIARIYTRECAGIQINILDIPKIYAAGRAAAATGADVTAAIVGAVATLRTDTLPLVTWKRP